MQGPVLGSGMATYEDRVPKPGFQSEEVVSHAPHPSSHRCFCFMGVSLAGNLLGLFECFLLNFSSKTTGPFAETRSKVEVWPFNSICSHMVRQTLLSSM